MAIVMAKQSGEWIYVYDENNHTLFTQTGKLHGYTSSSVTVQKGDWLYTYDVNGHQINATYAN